VEVDEFKSKWGFTQAEVALLMKTNRSTIAHWTGKGKHDSGRAGTTSAQMNLVFWDMLLTAWLESDRRFPEEYKVFLAAKTRGKGAVFKAK
jgi:hypothetical protein